MSSYELEVLFDNMGEEIRLTQDAKYSVVHDRNINSVLSGSEYIF